ncbi:hypothetical protein I6H88_21375 [Elizabethkingia bruuniana]|uniref:Imm33-like domain-containing protein n=2 Tax=Elizabethkingia TaxID=308865 RepID=A0A7T7UZA2_9FLAO|nr:hypothetical protein [Elizabethkingia bruuniana]KGO10015.1 hypothetical protein KS04_12010 [Elizabethkingia miricola]MCT3940438.1 hypothetical protein [Elizabethkingia anophelis]MCT4193646.1 hypothetical protein [Elizabethkingia anophelis]MDV3662792.1 hypothetical protein [Elizabethkingia anophelis]QDZ62236.1 hypothetical protein EVD20_04485 [Elizabethkingia bruuniana]
MMNKDYFEKQLKICMKYSQISDLVELDTLIALGRNFNPNIQINGLRHPRTETLNGWYIWSGEHSEAFDFFQPSHACHLLENASFVMSYLGLPAGNRFLIDNKGYEDVWFDETLLNV